MTLTELEKKIILLMMDPNATEGEQVNAATKLMLLFRHRFQDGHELVKDLESLPERKAKQSYQDLWKDFIFPFGKHKGKKLSEIPTNYLVWALAETQLFPATKKAVEEFLSGKRSPNIDPF